MSFDPGHTHTVRDLTQLHPVFDEQLFATEYEAGYDYGMKHRNLAMVHTASEEWLMGYHDAKGDQEIAESEAHFHFYKI